MKPLLSLLFTLFFSVSHFHVLFHCIGRTGILSYMQGSQKIFRGRPNISVGQPILVQLKYYPT